MQKAYVVSESTGKDERIPQIHAGNFSTFSLPGFSSHNVATQDAANEAAAKS